MWRQSYWRFRAMRPIWVGGTDQVGVIDGVLMLWYTLAQKRGRRIAFKLIAE